MSRPLSCVSRDSSTATTGVCVCRWWRAALFYVQTILNKGWTDPGLNVSAWPPATGTPPAPKWRRTLPTRAACDWDNGGDRYQVMRRLLSAVAATAALAAEPAIAVDYVQCREMLRTKNELLSLSAKKEVEHEGTHPLPAECRGWMLDEASKKTCADILAKEESKRKVYLTIGNRKIYSEEAAKLFNASMKVAGDMKKAGCPYQ